LVTRGRRDIKKILSQEVTASEKERVLELACGTGDFSPLFAAGSYTGVDLHEDYVRFARKKSGRVFAVMDSRYMGFKDDIFDGSICICFFHHLADQEVRLVLEELRRTLKDGGWGVIVDIIHPVSKYNLLGKLVEKLDQGEFLRYPKQYHSLFSE
jgi:ubiquinone/menaquinone biosynthesis C-methylase UbiE